MRAQDYTLPDLPAASRLPPATSTVRVCKPILARQAQPACCSPAHLSRPRSGICMCAAPGGPPVVRSPFPNPGRTAHVRGFLLLCLIAGLLAACGRDDNDGAQVQWIEGSPPPEFIAQVLDGEDGQAPTTAPTSTPDDTPDSEPTLTTAPSEQAAPTATATTAAPPAEVVSGGRLTDEQLAEYQPNELGVIPVLEYHLFTTDPDEEAAVHPHDRRFQSRSAVALRQRLLRRSAQGRDPEQHQGAGRKEAGRADL